MGRISFYLFISVAAFLSGLHCCARASNEPDKLALLQIKAKIGDDPFGVMGSWNDSLHFCEWYGVTCDHPGRQRVTKLDLESSKLSGTVSPYIGNLSFLKVLNLQNNTLRGTIPSEVGNLRRLQRLLLNNNSIGGVIPSHISGCSSLTVLDFAFNRLVGDIPNEVGSLLRLQLLSLPFNYLSGTIPSSLGNLSSLVKLSLTTNNLVGTVPESIGKLRKLTWLTLPQNKLSGLVPPSIFNLSFLTTLHLGENDFQGTLPWDLGLKLPNLDFFSISSNNFTGIIPASVANLSRLEYLLLNDNNLHGQVPPLSKLEKLQFLLLANNSLGNGLQDDDLDFVSSLANSTMLQVIDATMNDFNGKFPTIVCNFTMMYYLGLQSNEIDGQIPSCVDNLINLQVFQAGENNLSGVIPPGIGKLLQLSKLDLGTNRFSGTIPFSIGNLTQLTVLYLSENNFQGNIPSALGNCKNLLELYLARNNLSGNIPTQLFSLPNLSIELDLSHNLLNGSLPAEIGQLTYLGMLDVSHNLLSGKLPGRLGACLSMDTLYLGGNLFKGTIPDALETLRGLIALDLSQNKFSGKIPEFLGKLRLQMLNLSYNNLEGVVPTDGVFKNGTGVSVVGNIKLCGGRPELKLPKCSLESIPRVRKPGHRKRLILAILFAFLGVTLLTGILVLSYVFWCARKKESQASENSDKFLKLSYQSLLEATNGFSGDNIIGSGAYGVVYKGTLVTEKKLVAIKVFKLDYRGASQSFIVECGVLRNIRHRHLVKVITACSSVDYQGNDFKALVYEYMVNGSLEEWLHPSEEVGDDDTQDGIRHIPKMLNFQQRLDISVDVAFALEYLHHHSGASLVHCDLKPSNVLLDGELVAHVSDFGLAKFLSETESGPNHSSSAAVRGTVGYTPPEYGLGNTVSMCGDVYSFGILIQEMFTGKRPSDDMFKEGLSLHQFVKQGLPDRLTEIVDQAVLQDILREQMHDSSKLDALVSILELTLSCSDEIPRQRLDMSEVAGRLSSIRTKLQNTR